jgi:hypothetical protein
METKFTPGPWKIIMHKNRPHIFQDEWSNYDKWAIARIQNDEVGDIKANAHLIASCPVMFEYINKKADEGCEDAKSIIQAIWPS